MVFVPTVPSSDPRARSAQPLPAAFREAFAGQVDRAGAPGRAAGYLCDPAAVHGPGVLFLQLERIALYADGAGLVLPTSLLYVDSGSPDAGARRTEAAMGASLTRLLLDAEAGRVPLVLVDRLSRFSKDRAVAAGILARLRAFGVPVHQSVPRTAGTVASLRETGRGRA